MFAPHPQKPFGASGQLADGGSVTEMETVESDSTQIAEGGSGTESIPEATCSGGVSDKNAVICLLIADFVSAAYCTKWYPAKVVKFSIEEVSLDFLQIKGANKFSWPTHPNIQPIPITDVLCCITKPVECKRFWVMSKLDFDKSESALDRWCAMFVEYAYM